METRIRKMTKLKKKLEKLAFYLFRRKVGIQFGRRNILMKF